MNPFKVGDRVSAGESSFDYSEIEMIQGSLCMVRFHDLDDDWWHYGDLTARPYPPRDSAAVMKELVAKRSQVERLGQQIQDIGRQMAALWGEYGRLDREETLARTMVGTALTDAEAEAQGLPSAWHSNEKRKTDG